MRLDHYFLFQVGPCPVDALSCAATFSQLGISLHGASSRFQVEGNEIFECESPSLNLTEILAYFEYENNGDDFSCGFSVGESPFTAGFFTFDEQRLFLIFVENKYAPSFIDAIEIAGSSVYAIMADLGRSLHCARMILSRDPLHSDLLSSLQSAPEDAFKKHSVTALLLPLSSPEVNLEHVSSADFGDYRLYYNGDFF